MALNKSVLTDSGATGSYWKITGISVDKIQMVVIFMISLFTDQSYAHAAIPIPLKSRKFRVLATKEQLAVDVTSFCYGYLNDYVINTSDPDLGGAIAD